MNKAMITFGASEVVPVYYVLFVVSSIVAGMVLYHEYNWEKGYQPYTFFLGIFLTFSGIYVINRCDRVCRVQRV